MAASSRNSNAAVDSPKYIIDSNDIDADGFYVVNFGSDQRTHNPSSDFGSDQRAHAPSTDFGSDQRTHNPSSDFLT